MSMAELRVAVDIGSSLHRVAIGTGEGSILEEFEISHDRAGFELFFSRIAVHEKRLKLPVVVAMEGLGGWARPLDRMIQQHSYELLNVNNVKLARFKEIFAAPAKSDAIDTRKMLELMHMREVLLLAKAVLHRVEATRFHPTHIHAAVERPLYPVKLPTCDSEEPVFPALISHFASSVSDWRGVS